MLENDRQQAEEDEYGGDNGLHVCVVWSKLTLFLVTTVTIVVKSSFFGEKTRYYRKCDSKVEKMLFF